MDEELLKLELNELYRMYWKDEYTLDNTILKKMSVILALMRDCKDNTDFFSREVSVLFMLLYMKFITNTKNTDILKDSVKNLEKSTKMIVALRDMEG